MTLPTKILLAAAIESRENYEHIKADGEFSHFDDVESMVWGAVDAYYERDPAALKADTGLLEADLSGRLPNPKHARAVKRVLDGVAGLSAPNVHLVLAAARRRRIGDALSAALAARRDGDAAGLVEDYQKALADEARVGSGEEDGPVAWEGLVKARRSSDKRLQVTPRALNERLGGGLLPGHNVTIFARPETGKSAFCVSLACGFARRGHRVLYLVNEDPAQDLAVRVLTNLSGMLPDEVDSRPDEAERLALERGAANILLMDLVPSTMAEVTRAVKKYSPEVVIIDQMRNLTVSGKSDNFTQLLDRVSREIRNLGKEHGIVTISTTQAGDSASGKAVLDMGDIDSSNTGVPAAADLLLGIGITDTLERAGQRMISICKNKISGIKDHFSVNLDTARSRVTSN